MSERPSTGEIHAYVDRCLSREERAKFEARLSEDEELRRRVELWQAQSEAIRAAFGAPPSPTKAPSLGRVSNRNAPTPKAPVEPGARRRSRWADAPNSALAALVTLTLGLLVFPAGGPPDPRDALADAGIAAFRAFAALAPARLDIAVESPAELATGLGPEFRDFDLAHRLAAPGLTLHGARSVPGIFGRATLALIDVSGERVGLLIEPLDAPLARPPQWLARDGLAAVALTTDGFGVAIIGAKRGPVAALTTPITRREP